jgi:hypothetical protein
MILKLFLGKSFGGCGSVVTSAVNFWNLWGCRLLQNNRAPCKHLSGMPLWSGDTQKLMVTQFVKKCVAIEMLGFTSCCSVNYFTTGTTV